MAQTNFNVGAIANDGTGEPLRQAFQEQQAMNTELYTTKVDKVVGKELSDNNYTDAEVVKLDGIEAGAEVNVQADLLEEDNTQDSYVRGKEILLRTFIKSNENLTNAQRKDDTLYGILDQYTGEEITLTKTTDTNDADGIFYFDLGSEKFKRTSSVNGRTGNVVLDDDYIRKNGNFNEEKIGNLTVRKLTGDAISATKSDTGNAVDALVSGTKTHLSILNQDGGYIQENETSGAENIIRQKDAGNGLSFNSVKITPRSVSPADESFGKADVKIQGNVQSDDAIDDDDLVTLAQLNSKDKYKSTADMLAAESNAKIQSAGSWIYKLSDTETPRKLDINYTPTWDRKIAKGTDVKFEKFVIVPPTVPGHNNDHAVLSDVGADDIFYFAGVSDKMGRVYQSFDYGKTLIQIADLKTQFSYSECGIWAIKEMPNRELVLNMSVKEGLETHSYLFYSTDERTVWYKSVVSGTATPAQLTYYKEVDGGGAITFEVFGRIVNGWGLDVYKNFVLITEYGYPGVAGSSTDPTKDAVGHNITGKMFLSNDYGESFTQIFDYINPPTGINFVTFPGMHHGHGGFIDPYTINEDGLPRLVGIFGDAESRMVFSNDGGVSWFDGRNQIQNNAQAVAGMSVSGGYLTIPDSGQNTIQYTHRGLSPSNMASENVFFMMREEDKLVPELQSGIVYVGANIRQRTPNSPIVTLFTPETLGQYNVGARGGVAISYDEGRTWKEIWRDTEYGMLESIQTAMIFETKDGGIWISPSSTYPIDLGDGEGQVGRIIKLSVDKSDTTTKAEDDSVVHKTGNKNETITGKKTFSQETIFQDQVTMGTSPINFNDFQFISNAPNGFGLELMKKNATNNIISVRSDNFNIGIGGVADPNKKHHVFGDGKYNGKLEIADATDNNHAVTLGQLKKATGWASYRDTVYTGGSPFTIGNGVTSAIPNNAGTVINNQLPLGVTSFYNSGTGKITPELVGDYYITTIRLKATTTATLGGHADFGIDIGGSLGVIFKETVIFAKGVGVEHNFAFVCPGYTAATFVANGGIPKLTALGGGDVKIYDIEFQIDRTHRAI